MYTYVHKYTHKYTVALQSIYTQVICAYRYIHVHTYGGQRKIRHAWGYNTWVDSDIYSRIHIYTYVHVYTYTHTNKYTNIHTHTHAGRWTPIHLTHVGPPHLGRH